jgi:K+-transporting ATPase KdpF subunit
VCVGFIDDRRNGRIFSHGDRVHRRLREAEVAQMSLETIALLLVSVFLMVYLLFALLRPEKF